MTANSTATSSRPSHEQGSASAERQLRRRRVTHGEPPADQRALPRSACAASSPSGPQRPCRWGCSLDRCPALADQISGPNALSRSLLIVLAGGLVWQFVLVMALVFREQGTLRWEVLRDALWLRAPRAPKTGRRGGKAGLIVPNRSSPSPPSNWCPSDPIPPPGLRRFHRIARRACAPGRILGLVRHHRHGVRLQHGAGRGAAVPRVPASPDDRRLRPAGLACERRALRGLPPACAVDHPERAARHVHHRLPLEALPQALSGSPCTARSQLSSVHSCSPWYEVAPGRGSSRLRNGPPTRRPVQCAAPLDEKRRFR